MNIKLIETTTYSKEICRTLAEWYNDPLISGNIHVNKKEAPLEGVSAEELYATYNQRKRQLYLAYDADHLIGECSIDMEFFMLGRPDKNTAWISILIGDKNYWGSGAATIMMELLEAECKRRGAKRIELGVFEFNSVAQRFYKKLGYVQFKVYEQFTYYEGRWWDDYRMEKKVN